MTSIRRAVATDARGIHEDPMIVSTGERHPILHRENGDPKL
jgi:hypothetical protein